MKMNKFFIVFGYIFYIAAIALSVYHDNNPALFGWISALFLYHINIIKKWNTKYITN